MPETIFNPKKVLKTSIRLLHGVILSSDQFPFEYMGFSNSSANTLANIPVLRKALQVGVVIDPKLLNLDPAMYNSISMIAINEFGVESAKLNQSFYHSFEQMKKASDLELLVTQLMNYHDAYTADGYVAHPEHIFTMNNVPAHLVDVQKNLVIIKALTVDDLQNSVNNYVTSNTALSDAIIQDLSLLIDTYKIKLDYSKINNKEFLLKLWANDWINTQNGYIPHNFEMATRLLLTIAMPDNKTQLISKSKLQRDTIQDFTNTILNDDDKRYQLINVYFDKLVKAFNHGKQNMPRLIQRYHTFYLQIKPLLNKANKRELNRIFRHSKKMSHVKYKQPAIDHILDLFAQGYTTNQMTPILEQASTAKLVKLYNAMKYHTTFSKYRYFIIRNGNSYLLDNSNKNNIQQSMVSNYFYGKALSAKIQEILVKRLAPYFDHSVVLLPDNIKYAMPSSTKTLVGVLPYMSEMTISKPILTVGISWDKPADLDLHASLLDGTDIGWNGDYYSKSHGIYFSGDMTALVKGHAAEYMEIDSRMCEKQAILFNVNLFDCDNTNLKYDFDLLISGKKDINNKNKSFNHQIPDNSSNQLYNQMVEKIDKNSILMKHLNLDYANERTKTLAIAIPQNNGWKIIFIGHAFNNNSIPNINLNIALTDVLKAQADSALYINDLIKQIILNGNTDVRVTHSALETKLLLQSEEKFDLPTRKVIDLSNDKIVAESFLQLLKY